jgi:ABC-2 type transport system permease protein
MLSTIRHLPSAISKYAAITRINLQSNLAYIGEFAYRSIFMVLILYVFIQLWTTTYSVSGSTNIAGFALRDTIWYLVMTETIMLSRMRIANKIAEEVRDGSLAYTVGRPYSYLLYQFFHSFGDTLLRMIINFIAGSILITALISPMPATNLPAVIVSVLLALILDFCIIGVIGLLSFFTEDVNSFDIIYQKILFILGGMIIPLDFLPTWLRDISLALPFNYIIYAPSRLFVQFDASRWLNTVVMQLVWIGIMGVVLSLVFRWGMRRVSINGG